MSKPFVASRDSWISPYDVSAAIMNGIPADPWNLRSARNASHRTGIYRGDDDKSKGCRLQGRKA